MGSRYHGHPGGLGAGGRELPTQREVGITVPPDHDSSVLLVEVERILDCLKSYCAAVTTADGKTEDYELWGSEEWDGQQGFPVLVKKWDDSIGAGVGERFTIDAKHILIH